MDNLPMPKFEGPITVVVLRYNGYWTNIRTSSRVKYEGGKQKTISMERGKTTLKDFGEIVAKFCGWVRGRLMKLTYVRPGAVPKDYIQILSNVEFRRMLDLYGHLKIKMFMVTEETKKLTRSLMVNQRVSRSRRTSSRNLSSSRARKVDIMDCSDEEREGNSEDDDRYVKFNEDDMLPRNEAEREQFEHTSSTRKFIARETEQGRAGAPSI